VLVSPYLLHRDERSWNSPDQFRPERFAPSAPPPPHGAFIPFGAGPRQCIGMSTSYQEAQIILSGVARRYRLEVAGTHQAEWSTSITLAPRGGLPATLRPLSGEERTG
jgi:cytochrome P450